MAEIQVVNRIIHQSMLWFELYLKQQFQLPVQRYTHIEIVQYLMKREEKSNMKKSNNN